MSTTVKTKQPSIKIVVGNKALYAQRNYEYLSCAKINKIEPYDITGVGRVFLVENKLVESKKEIVVPSGVLKRITANKQHSITKKMNVSLRKGVGTSLGKPRSYSAQMKKFIISLLQEETEKKGYVKVLTK
ncbi:MAG: hypothetical protein FWC10_06445 [Lentimicrobiaceae bacterium]|nr:hypothetical protein [Lentimicrobiaceae bacterium]